MKREVHWTTSSVQDFYAITTRDSRLAKRILDSIRGFAADGRGDLKKLKGRQHDWRIRVGDWRIVLSMDGYLATVTAIDNRRDAY